MAPESEALILNASRAELVDKILERGLADGRLIVCDRFWDATLAYQGFGRGLPIDTLLTISMFAARRLQPDLTFFLDVTPSVSRERLRSRTAIPDRMERESSAFHERVADGYRRLAAAEPHRFVTIDGTKEEVEIAVEVRQIVLSRWQSRV
jgi:dTMP kinase